MTNTTPAGWFLLDSSACGGIPGLDMSIAGSLSIYLDQMSVSSTQRRASVDLEIKDGKRKGLLLSTECAMIVAFFS